jgi:quercetin dioxygenase-like cupin family protein
MIIRGSEIQAHKGRKPYELGGQQVVAKHFVARTTTPDNPFEPHRHEQPELWYILEGQAMVRLGEDEQVVSGGDLIVIEPWVDHGLRTADRAVWICLG